MGKNFRETLNEQMKDPEFRAEWEAQEPERQIMHAILEIVETHRLPDAQPEHRRRQNLNAAFFCFIHVFLCSCSFSRFQNITSCMRIQSFIFSSLDMKVIKHYTGIK